MQQKFELGLIKSTQASSRLTGRCQFPGRSLKKPPHGIPRRILCSRRGPLTRDAEDSSDSCVCEASDLTLRWKVPKFSHVAETDGDAQKKHTETVVRLNRSYMITIAKDQERTCCRGPECIPMIQHRLILKPRCPEAPFISHTLNLV